MSQEATPGKGNPWTDEAKIQFLLRIIAQLKEDGRTVNWSRLRMEGRTTKSLQNMWFRITKEIAEMEAKDAGEGGLGTPTKAKATPQKSPRKLKKSAAWIAANGGIDSDDETTKKRDAREFIRCREQDVNVSMGGENFIDVLSIRTAKREPSRKKVKRSDSEDDDEVKAEKDDMGDD
ncbi:hypothetical protein CP532_2768 [Ophiocordyceps camponoti-leonardi (nom. inval.)]|nr:hypothetical protein CP532_2768 [Ophiocordyceps camponoti-leonardi (nom. inval.)]